MGSIALPSAKRRFSWQPLYLEKVIGRIEVNDFPKLSNHVGVDHDSFVMQFPASGLVSCFQKQSGLLAS